MTKITLEQFINYCKKQDACRDAIKWLHDQTGTLEEAYDNCDKIEWLQWIYGKLGIGAEYKAIRDPARKEYVATAESCYAAWKESEAARKEYEAARKEYVAAWEAYCAARKEYDAALESCEAAWKESVAARKEYVAAWKSYAICLEQKLPFAIVCDALVTAMEESEQS